MKLRARPLGSSCVWFFVLLVRGKTPWTWGSFWGVVVKAVGGLGVVVVSNDNVVGDCCVVDVAFVAETENPEINNGCGCCKGNS